MGVFITAAKMAYRWGFPLDDAWIHQTYARNLATWGQWAYRLGVPSAGVTAPLWVVLQATGQRLGLSPLVWSTALGWVTLTALGLLVWAWWRAMLPTRGGWWPWAVGASVAGAWHLVWAALSGMETALFALLMTALVLWGGRAARRWGGLAWGAAVGGAVWLRPEAMLALPAVAAAWLLQACCPPRGQPRLPWGQWARQVVALGVGFGLLFGPYLGFNAWLSGHIWPNTFYAKQAEYAILRQWPLWRRFGHVSAPLLAGMGGVLLLPAIAQVIADVRARRWAWMAAPLWAGLHVAAYAVRLPVAYQHGRYVLPVVPVLLVWGWRGLAASWPHWEGRLTAAWALSRTWALAAGVAGLLFLGIGARAYARDVAFVESEMVAAARWLPSHLPAGTVVAAHDIGAMGYFTDFPLVDMAGLVSPEVIPFIGDERALCAFLDRQHVRVLVAFPDWYPHLTAGLTPLYANSQGWGPRLGGTHMTVYAWRGSCAILWAWP
ncbi:MAG TPA: hypothetical protein ENJ54_06435 [Chloroflexi bacterium]|nr:hypothetical protein [Chloroflexota bacterium]